MLLEELKNIPSTKKDLRNFGLVMAVAAAVIGGFLLWKDKPAHLYLFITAAAAIVVALAVPILLWPFHRVWMILAGILGYVMSRIILGVLFFLVVTPMALIGRAFGKRFLDTRMGETGKKDGRDTYWSYRKQTEDATTGREKYEQQF